MSFKAGTGSGASSVVAPGVLVLVTGQYIGEVAVRHIFVPVVRIGY